MNLRPGRGTHLRTFISVLQRGHCVGGASGRDLGLSCGIIICDTELGALNGFGLFSQLGPDQCHQNQQRPHFLIARRFRARAAVRSLLSALVYNGKAAHGPREDVTRQVGASSCRERPQGLLLPMTLRSPLVRFGVSRLSTQQPRSQNESTGSPESSKHEEAADTVRDTITSGGHVEAPGGKHNGTTRPLGDGDVKPIRCSAAHRHA
jgi:hypothetical protein